MMQYWKSHFKVLILILGIIILQSCANIVPPTGGPEDRTPPVLISVQPQDSLLNTRVTKIEFRFNKNMEVDNWNENFTISPLLKHQPEVSVNRKRVTVKIADSLLEDNVTYLMDFGKALTDNREKTPAQQLKYTFATGDYFDSLSVKGRVLKAENSSPDKEAVIILHDINMTDSMIMTDLPKYAVHPNEEGYFNFQMLPDKEYRIFAIRESAKDYKWSPSAEGIGFIDTIIKGDAPKAFENALLLYTSRARLSSDTTSTDDKNDSKKRSRTGESTDSKKSIQKFEVLVDTTQEKKHEFFKPLTIAFADSSQTEIDFDRIFLSYEIDGTELEAILETKMEGDSLWLNTEWRENTIYTLRLVKDWAKQGEDYLDPGKYTFSTNSLKDYANLKLKAEEDLKNNNYRVLVIQDKDTLIHQSILKEDISLERVQPKDINIFVYQDLNNNEQWDAGDYWTLTAPEIVIPVIKDGALRGGWDNEFSLKLEDDPVQLMLNYFEALSKSSMRESTDKKEESEEEE